MCIGEDDNALVSLISSYAYADQMAPAITLVTTADHQTSCKAKEESRLSFRQRHPLRRPRPDKLGT